ncbi:MAG: apolipoprotein N-acyltransferase [Chlamydiota bacterium]
MAKGKQICGVIFSWAVVAFGQPHYSVLLSLVVAGVGVAFFWSVLMQIKTKRLRFGLSLGWFTAVQLVQLSWLASPKYQGLYIILVYLALALWLGVQFGGLSLLLPAQAPISWLRMLLIASAWTLCEWSRLFVFCGFVWNPLGLTLSAHPLPAQLASLWGVFGLSFWVVLVNLIALNVFFAPKRRIVTAWLGCFLFPYIWGVLQIGYHSWRQHLVDRKKLTVALVQPALFPDQKQLWPGSIDRFVPPFDQWQGILSALETKRNQGKAFDLIVLPEAAVQFDAYACVYPYYDVVRHLGNVWQETQLDLKELLRAPLAKKSEGKWFVSNAFWVQSLANYYQSEVVVGLGDCDLETGDCYNAAFHFVPKQKTIRRYEKQILLPLAEYLPLSFLQPLVARYGIHSSFVPGKEAKVFSDRFPMSISVCYEECFGDRMRAGRQKGAELFVNVTNDGWYPFSQLPKQHFAHSYLRTLENGVPLVRACNTGVTVAVDSLGQVIEQLEGESGDVETVSGVLVSSVNLYSYKTLYTFWGDQFIVGISMVCLFIGLSKIFLRKICGNHRLLQGLR